MSFVLKVFMLPSGLDFVCLFLDLPLSKTNLPIDRTSVLFYFIFSSLLKVIYTRHEIAPRKESCPVVVAVAPFSAGSWSNNTVSEKSLLPKASNRNKI